MKDPKVVPLRSEPDRIDLALKLAAHRRYQRLIAALRAEKESISVEWSAEEILLTRIFYDGTLAYRGAERLNKEAGEERYMITGSDDGTGWVIREKASLLGAHP